MQGSENGGRGSILVLKSLRENGPGPTSPNTVLGFINCYSVFKKGSTLFYQSVWTRENIFLNAMLSSTVHVHTLLIVSLFFIFCKRAFWQNAQF
jgi:hypothetical protein